jgi:isoquinoline 1-oxidoreductase beta subunit
MRRRSFLIGSAAIVGGLAVGYRAWSRSFEREAAELVSRDGEHLLAGWIRIGADDTVTVQIPHVDMGQGIYTALAMMAAEELDADWSNVRTERAPGEKAFANRFLARGWVTQGFEVPRFADGLTDVVFTEAARFVNLQITGGSTAVRFTGQVGMRVVAAAARQMLVEAAARRWDVSPRQLIVRDGVVTDPSSGQTARFGALASEASHFSVPSNPRLKKRSEWRLVGTSPLRLDIPAKTDGTFGYGIDLQLPDMMYAAVRAAPVHGGRLLGVDTEPVEALPDVERVIPLQRAVAVVAASWWQASRALDLLDPEFSSNETAAFTQADLERMQNEALESETGETVVTLGDASGAIRSANASRRFEATYRVPYLHHAAMEPINATAQFAGGVLTFWGGEQDALGTKVRLAELSGLAASKVVVHGLPAGGSFGRRIAPSADYLDYLVPIVRALGPRPVKLILSREEEFTHGAYRPALATQMTAAIDAEGMPIAWMQRYLNGPTRNEAFHIPYLIPNQAINSIDFATHVQTGTWRSVAHTQHAFWTECFIDEMAHAAGRDPFDYRRMLLPEGSRARRVLEVAAGRAGWGEALPPGFGRGIALAESYGTWVAEVVEASLDEDGAPRIHRVVAAVDCGGLVHPDTALQQVEGGIIMGLSAAFREKITLENGAVAQTNFLDYPVLRLPEIPKIEVHFLESDGAWGGLGEPGVPPAAPALANALFAATGQRIRRLPIIDALSSNGGRV